MSLLVLARGVAAAALLSTFGTLTFRVVVAPRAFVRMAPAQAARIAGRLLQLTQASCAAGVVAMLAWLVLQAADMADADSVGKAIAAVPLVVKGTDFGHLIVAQMAVLLAAAATLGWREHQRRRTASWLLAALATALQAGHGHALSMYGGPSVLLACDVLHLLGAGAWLGGLFPLLLLVRNATPRAGATAARWFSPLGQICIAALAVSAAFQGWVLVASIAGLVGTGYGTMVLVKLALSAVLLGFAAANRYRFAPALVTEGTGSADKIGTARRVLVRSIAVQTGFGVAIVAAAVILTSLPPAMHEQPNWPFPVRLSLDAVREDAGLRREVIAAGLGVAGAVALLGLAAVSRRVRWLAAALAVVVAWLSVPHFELLLVEAYPTSFYHSPTGFAATSIAAGAKLYPLYCAACHGADGRGDGPAGKNLPIPPADLTAAHIWMHDDGEMFWWLSHGIAGVGGRLVMPGFAAALSDGERWALIDSIRAANAGAAMRRTEAWPTPIQAPDFQAVCNGRTLMLSDLRGKFVRLVIGPAPPPPTDGQAPAPEPVTVATVPGPDSPACIAADAEVPIAYAVVSGMTLAALPGTQFLIDGDGWLRALQRPGAAESWNDAQALAAEIGEMRDHPIAPASGKMQMGKMDMPM